MWHPKAWGDSSNNLLIFHDRRFKDFSKIMVLDKRNEPYILDIVSKIMVLDKNMVWTPRSWFLDNIMVLA
jgi:hypothetical protein